MRHPLSAPTSLFINAARDICGEGEVKWGTYNVFFLNEIQDQVSGQNQDEDQERNQDLEEDQDRDRDKAKTPNRKTVKQIKKKPFFLFFSLLSSCAFDQNK